MGDYEPVGGPIDNDPFAAPENVVPPPAPAAGPDPIQEADPDPIPQRESDEPDSGNKPVDSKRKDSLPSKSGSKEGAKKDAKGKKKDKKVNKKKSAEGRKYVPFGLGLLVISAICFIFGILFALHGFADIKFIFSEEELPAPTTTAAPAQFP